jgi:type VI secretion system protein ImpH
VSGIEDARRQGFMPLVMLLERLVGGPGVGAAASPDEEAIRFRHDPSLSFSPSDVTSVHEFALDPGPDGARRAGYEVTTAFLGLTGGVTPLPQFMAEEVAQEDPDAPRMREFLDLFHHRLIALFYRGLMKYDLAGSSRADESDAWVARLLALLGVDLAPGETRPPLAAWRLLRLSPLLVEPTLTAAGLAAAIADALAEERGHAQVQVEPFAGEWVRISEDEVTRLGRVASCLGRDCLLGQKVFDPAGRFRVRIGPLSGEQYGRFASGDATRRVEELVDALVSEPLEHEIVLWLEEDAAPALRLGASRLGRNTWLGSQVRLASILARKAA